MKNLILSFALYILFLNATGLAQEPIPPIPFSTIQVKGNATVKVVPDIFNWQVNIHVDMDDLQSAKRSCDISTSKVLELLRTINVNSNDIKTSGLMVTKNQPHPPNNNTKRFSVSNSIWFSITDISRYDELTTSLTDIENVYINPVNSDYSKAIEVRRQARVDALKAARQKAEEMADVYGLEIGKALTIVEGQFGWYPNPFNAVTQTGETNYNSSFSSGMINVTAEVTVTFELRERMR